MGMIVQHNMNAINAYNRLNANVAGLKKASEKLASGYRINRAGDDAAGLAISEKMRSQIKGLNQAVRNSQDGINMIQTYEGAAQETHSILQRMKELATQSANGTYDNATDRAAIQLEFDQLNDELNQIADTDFNGTVVLNGGVMADGTVAKNGEFRYAEGYTETVVANSAADLSGAQAHTMVDQTNYNKSVADSVYNAVKVDVKDVADATTKKATINVTFMYDGERWVADTVTDKEGNVIDGARAAGLEAREVDRDNATGKGGFEVIAGKDPYTSKDIVATNVIFDEMIGPVKKGDTVTVSFDNTAATTYAPENGGIMEDSITPDKASATFTEGEVRNLIGFKLSSTITDDTMDADLKAVLTDFASKAEATATYAGGKVDDLTTVTISGTDTVATYEVDADGNVKATSADSGKEYVLGKITLNQFVGSTPAQDAKVENTAITVATATGMVAGTAGKDALAAAIVAKLATGATATDTEKFTVTATMKKADSDANDTWNITYTYKDEDGNNVDGTATMTGADMKAVLIDPDTGNALVTGDAYKRADLDDGDKIVFDYTAATSPKNDLDATKEGDVKFKFNVDAFNYVDTSDLNVHAIATPTAATMATQVAAGNVSVADSFDNSTGVLTYAKNLTLQTGARTKDSVNFNFSYNKDGTADMGSLVANLDLSSRSTGLNTANLSLANQNDANYAIDQIDKAINKTSMVRATFGSIQNRLEHKITNLTTTAENLTEAESSIRDTDMASEMMNYTKFNILQQAAQSMLAQANQQPQSILQLLG